MHRVIGERDLGETPFDAERARTLLDEMVRARAFDERALALARRGWMSGYPPFRGQEASQVAAGLAMRERDWLFPTYRSNAMQLVRGVPMADLLAFRRGHAEFRPERDGRGDERSDGHGEEGAVRAFPQAVPVASQLPHAVGVGMAADHRGTDEVAVAYLGDGATSQGDFHEALNFAGVFEAPVCFFCENNGWAISTPRERQTASDTIAGKAEAYGFRGGQVDGTDPLAVHEFVASALARVREGNPVLVESLTYRLGPHTTSDDPARYEDRSSVPAWRTRDPLERYEEYLREQGVVGATFREDARAAAEAELDAAIERAAATPNPDPGDLFAFVYADETPRLAAQRARLEEFEAARERRGER